jgi:putative transposase
MNSKNTYYRRHLPHIHPEGYPLFITFRLADSLPAEILAELQAQRDHDLKTLKNKSTEDLYNIEKKHFSRYDAWLDRCASDPRWLEYKNIAGIFAEKIHSIDGEHFKLMACCIMPNHVHLIIQSILSDHFKHRGKTAKYPIADALRLLKGATARSCMF